MSRQRWSKAFYIILLIDSAVFILKLALAIWLIVSGAQEHIRYNQRDENSEGDFLTGIVIFFFYFGGISLLILVLIRWFLNFIQYRNENRMDVSTPAHHCSPHVRRFCTTFFWFFVGIIHIALVCTMIALDWTEGRWLRKVAISLLCWETLILFFMITYKCARGAW